MMDDPDRRRLLIHIGPHKTGTSAIQKTLRYARDRLAKNGIVYNDLQDHPGGIHRLADLASTSKFDQAQPLLDDINKSSGLTILSSENFTRLNPGQVRQLIDRLDADDLRVVYYLRNPLNRLPSDWKELIKHGYGHSFGEWLAARFLTPLRDRTLNPGLAMGGWADAVGSDRFDIHLYDRIEDAAAQFLDLYCDGERQTIPGRQNESYTLARTEALRALGGYQRHLIRCRDFDADVDALEQRIEDAGKGFVQTIRMSLDQIVMKRIEAEIIHRFGPSIQQPIDNAQLFETRTADWPFLAAQFWFANDDVLAQATDLRRRIHTQLGPPQADPRLAEL